jgi:carbonic anhydrase
MDIIYRYDPYAEIRPRPFRDPDAALRALQEGHRRYLEIVNQVQRELAGKANPNPEPIVIPADPLRLGFPPLVGAAPLQAPYALVLGCSDARVPIERVFDQSPNDLFVIRVAGNVLGAECLGSIDYAVQHLAESLKLLVVLGHSGCGAVTAAVDTYLTPKDYSDIAFTHALRSLVDRIHIAVRGAAQALERVCGTSVVDQPNYRAALLEAAVYLNAAVTGFDVRREVAAPSQDRTRVVYGVFDLVEQRVRALPVNASPDATPFGDVPSGPEAFKDLGTRVAEAVVAKGLIRSKNSPKRKKPVIPTEH